MNQIILEKLRCPVCAAGMTREPDGKSIFCTGERRHMFDLSRRGYVNLGQTGKPGGDDRDMVHARSQFLEAGYYQPIRDGVLAALASVLPAKGTVIDAGCGEGYYTNAIAENGYTVLGVDLSKSAVDAASAGARRIAVAGMVQYAVASIFRIPVSDASFDAVVSIFAPCAESEVCRVLRPGGYFIVVGAGEDHLMGLKKRIYEHAYPNDERRDLPRTLVEVEKFRIRKTITVTGETLVSALFSMTPYYWRTAEEDRKKLSGVTTLETELDVWVRIFRKESEK